jgi:hypothetical protein
MSTVSNIPGSGRKIIVVPFFSDFPISFKGATVKP